MPATHGLLGRIIRANNDAAQRFGQNTAEVDAFIQAVGLLTPWQWRQVLTARRLVSTLAKEDDAQLTEALRARRAPGSGTGARLPRTQAAGRTTAGPLPEAMSQAREALCAAMEKQSDDKVATAWQALSA